MTTETRTETHYISCADSAKLMRKALKAAFPGQKFSVRSDVYSGGASIDVTWTDGPLHDEVNRIAGQFQGASFDGMIDMEIGNTHWMNPDGSVDFAYTPGSEGQRGSCPEVSCAPRHPEARLVRFASKYVFCNRKYSLEYLDRVARETAKTFGRIAPEVKDNGFGAYLHGCNDYEFERLILQAAEGKLVIYGA